MVREAKNLIEKGKIGKVRMILMLSMFKIGLMEKINKFKNAKKN